MLWRGTSIYAAEKEISWRGQWRDGLSRKTKPYIPYLTPHNNNPGGIHKDGELGSSISMFSTLYQLQRLFSVEWDDMVRHENPQTSTEQV
jgi:hypothetical protein